MKVFYVTGFELGWDCMIGIFDASKVTEAELKKAYPEDQYYIDEKTVQTKVDSYE